MILHTRPNRGFKIAVARETKSNKLVLKEARALRILYEKIPTQMQKQRSINRSSGFKVQPTRIPRKANLILSNPTNFGSINVAAPNKFFNPSIKHFQRSNMPIVNMKGVNQYTMHNRLHQLDTYHNG